MLILDKIFDTYEQWLFGRDRYHNLDDLVDREVVFGRFQISGNFTLERSLELFSKGS